MPTATQRQLRRVALAMVTLAGAVVGMLGPASSAGAQASSIDYSTQPETIGPSQLVVAALLQPTTPTSNESTALVVAHQIPVGAETPCQQMAQRGFTVVCTQETGATWDELARGIGYGVSYARSLPGVRRVVLLGWSGGGSMVAYYQNVAENGISVCQARARLDPCGRTLAGLPRADGVVFLDAIPGLAFSFLSALDAATAQPNGLTGKYKKSLYLFSPANGYNPNPNESSSYSASFINAYTAAQARREATLVGQAHRLQARFARANGRSTPDNRPFPVARDAARIWQQDTSLLAHTKERHLLITPQSPSGTTQTVHSVRVPSVSPIPSSPQANSAPPTDFTVSTFLSTSAITAPNYRLTADSIEGVDWGSSNTSTVINVPGITVPLLMMSMGAHYWIVPSEMYYSAARRSHDKTLAYVEGALHVFSPCTMCHAPTSTYGDTEAEVFNYVSSWLETRY